MTNRHLLVVCTANVCRSPVAERLLQRSLADARDVDGAAWRVTSAGTGEYQAALDPGTVRAAAAIGIDLADHRSRRLDRDILAGDGADLVVTMARNHLPTVVGIDPGAWPRTFTLKELARRASMAGSAGDGFAMWRERMAAGRRASEMMRPDPLDDVADPYGLPQRDHDQMVAELASEIDRLVRWGPWTSLAAAP